MILIGIDPDKGWAEYDTVTKKLLDVETVDFWGIITRIMTTTQLIGDEAKIYCEAPQKNAPVWTKGKTITKDVLAIKMKIAQDVGRNKCKAELIGEYCLRNNIRFEFVKPTKKSLTKLKAEDFKKITGYEGRTSEHGRDAAMLVYGRLG